MASVGKALVSIGCGMMLKEKHDLFPDGLNQKVFTEKYLPEAFPLDDPLQGGHHARQQLLTMSAGFHGEGSNPGFIDFEPTIKLDPLPRNDLGQDMNAIRTPLWVAPGGGYSYASTSPHVASIVLRHAMGMELKDYLDVKLAKPMGWGAWGYAHAERAHAPAAGIARYGPRTRCAFAICFCTRASGAGNNFRVRGLRRGVRQTFAIPEARAVQPDVRGERRPPRGFWARRAMPFSNRAVAASVSAWCRHWIW